jgi:sulfite exporter TauE/SafE
MSATDTSKLCHILQPVDAFAASAAIDHGFNLLSISNSESTAADVTQPTAPTWPIVKGSVASTVCCGSNSAAWATTQPFGMSWTALPCLC